MTTKKAKIFGASFAITAICIGAVCGFLAVDLSSDRYMPGQLAPFFQVSDVDEAGIEFAWMGTAYQIDAVQAQELQTAAWEYRGLVPRSLRLAGAFAVRCMDWVEEIAVLFPQPEE